MWPFKKKQNIYKVTYIPCAEIHEEKGEVICRLCNMREVYVEAENLFEAQKNFADMKIGKVTLTPHIYIDRITEVMHKT